jgi:membrane protein
MSAALEPWRQRARRYLDHDLWQGELGRSVPVQIGRAVLQVAVIVAQGVARNQTLLRASALTYFTMLSLIPLLAVAIGLVEAFGASKDIVEFVVSQIAAVSPEAGTWLRERVENVDFGGLGAVGGATLVITTVLALSSVENALNHIWGVARHRPLVRRFPDYLAVLVVAPLLLTVAISLATTLRSEAVVERLLENPELESLFRLSLGQAPTLLFWVAFSFLYWFLPNTNVRPLPALAGGALAAALFALLQWGYVSFQVGAARSNALFGSFAAIPILLVWIYFSWTIVLLGAELAFAVQNRASFRRAREGEEPRPAEREAIGLAVATRMARGFCAGEAGFTAEGLAEELDVPVRTVRSILTELETAGLVAPRGDAKLDGYQLGRAAERITVVDLLDALRGSDEAALRRVASDPALQTLLEEVDHDLEATLRGRTLADLVGSVDPSGRRP